MNELRVCVVGLGLMGGSLALALRGHVGALIGVDRHAATRQQALRDNVVDVVTDDVTAGVAQADLIVLATPVNAILALLAELPALRPSGCAVLDIGSTKSAIHAAMDALPETFQAIGGHPMCGRETAGLQAADAALYRDQTFILTRTARTTPDMEALALALVAAIGARPLFLDPQMHDDLVAAVSHLPYLIAAALMHAATAVDDARVWSVSASGFRDTSRLSGSDPRMMLDILLTNRAPVLAQLTRYQEMLTAVAGMLATGDERGLASWLAAAQRDHVAYRKAKERPPDAQGG